MTAFLQLMSTCHIKRLLTAQWRHLQFSLADRTNSRAIGTVLRPSAVCTECIVAKRCVLEQKLLLRAYWKSYMINRLVPK